MAAELLTPKEVAARLSVSPRTVYSWLEEGRLPSVKLSERITRVPEDAVEALVSRETRPARVSELVAEERASYCVSCGTAIAPEGEPDATRVRRELLKTHRTEIEAIASRRRATNLRVFGSVARGDARSDSDIDLVVDLMPHASLFDLGGLVGELELLLGVSVDVVPERSLKPRVRDRVLREAVPL